MNNSSSKTNNIINNTGTRSSIIKKMNNQSKVLKIPKRRNRTLKNEKMDILLIQREKNIYNYIVEKGGSDLILDYYPTENDSLQLADFRLYGYITVHEYIKDHINEMDTIRKHILKKLETLHHIGLYHRDLHFRNIIIKKDDITDIRFIDFGLSIIDNDFNNLDEFIISILNHYFYYMVSLDYLYFIKNIRTQENPNKNTLSIHKDKIEDMKRIFCYNDILYVNISYLNYYNIIRNYFPTISKIDKEIEKLQEINNLFLKQDNELNKTEKNIVLLFNNIFYELQPYILPVDFYKFYNVPFISNNNSTINMIIQNTKNNQVSNYLSTNRNDIIQYIELNVLDDVTSGVSSSIYRIPGIENIIVKRTPYQRFGESFIYENINNFTYIPKYYGEYKKNGINYLFLEYLDPRNGWENVDNFDLEIYKQVISALKGLHSAGIYHCNLNALNIMINNRTNEIKFIDFKKSVNNNMINNSIIKVENGGLMFNYNNSFSFFQEKEYYKVCTDYLKLLQNNNTIIDNKDSLKEILKRNDFLELGFLFLSSIINYFEIYENLFHIQENNNEPITEIIQTQENILEIIKEYVPEFLSIFEEYFMNKNPYIEEFELLNNEQNELTLLPPKKR